MITKAIDEGNYTVSIFLALSKAFDTINNSILLSKLDLCGIRAGENQWLQYYLRKQKLKVFCNGVESNFYLMSTSRVNIRAIPLYSLYKRYGQSY